MKDLSANSIFTFFGDSNCFIVISVLSQDNILVVFHHSQGGKKVFLYGLAAMADNDFVILSYLELFNLVQKNLARLYDEAVENKNMLVLGDMELLIALTNACCINDNEAFSLKDSQNVCLLALKTDFEVYKEALHDLLDYFSSSVAPLGYEFLATTENEKWIDLCGMHVGAYYRANTLLELFSILLHQLELLDLTLYFSEA